MKNLENIRRFVELDMLDNEIIDVVTNLIDMHTEPLKLEELRRNMWIWDMGIESYCRITEVRGKIIESIACGYDDWFYAEFEEGRFYRYQPLE